MNELERSIPVAEIAAFEENFREKYSVGEFTIVGPYRRNQPSHTIHLLINSSDETDIDSLLSNLKDDKIVTDDLEGLVENSYKVSWIHKGSRQSQISTSKTHH
jgi:hypothetical protein